MAALDTFIALRDYIKGKIDSYDLKESDDLIYRIKENQQNRGQSGVVISFNNEEEFLKFLGLHEDDIWFYQVINSPYNDYEFMDSYSVKEDFENGWGLYFSLDDENKEKLADISRIILPMKVNFEDEKFRNKLSEKLLINFKDDTEDILDDFQLERNREMSIVARESIEKELKEYLNKFDFDNVGDDGFTTTVADLIMLYVKENAIHLSLKELIKKISEDSSVPGGWHENTYEYQDDTKFDKESFNNYTSSKLDKILEKLEDSEEGVTIQDYTEMTQRITKKFEQDKYYNLPKDLKKETRFKIDGFLYPAMKVVVTLSKGMKQRKVKLSEDNFYNLLYQPSLFNLDEI
jgi:hypothetical protein